MEGKLYGDQTGEIRYGALSTDGRGLSSYGDVALRLRDVAIAQRTTVLHENSYDFAARHRIGLTDSWPLGFLGAWDDRALVAVAKHAETLPEACNDGEFETILLSSQGDRATDRFVEAHVFGPFSVEAVQSIRSVTRRADEETAHLLRLVSARAAARNIPWET